MKIVKFITGWQKYHAGEVAGFDEDDAQWLVERKYAAVVPESEASAEQKPSKPAKNAKAKDDKSDAD